MIVVLTPNPSIDRTVHVRRLVHGGLVRADSAAAEPAGKGINVARALVVHAYEAISVAPLSPSAAPEFAEALGAGRLDAFPIEGAVRVNVSVVEPDGTVTKINEPGPRLTEAAAAGLLERVVAAARRVDARWVVGSGSLPPGAPEDLYARLIRMLPAGVRTAVDADRAALAAAVAVGPTLVKVNRAELEELVGRPLATLGEVVAAAGTALDQGSVGVLASLGRDGAVYVDRDAASHAEAPIDDVVNTVGAGDALLAGFLAAGATHASLPTAVAWSVAACRSPGTRIRPVEDGDRASVIVHGELHAARDLTAEGRPARVVIPA